MESYVRSGNKNKGKRILNSTTDETNFDNKKKCTLEKKKNNIVTKKTDEESIILNDSEEGKSNTQLSTQMIAQESIAEYDETNLTIKMLTNELNTVRGLVERMKEKLCEHDKVVGRFQHIFTKTESNARWVSALRREVRSLGDWTEQLADTSEDNRHTIEMVKGEVERMKDFLGY
jgi:hypothetical protein